MKRNIYDDLLAWKDRSDRKPLILEGARQVGKTYILKEFGDKEFSNLIYINCHNNKFTDSLFTADYDISRILRSISAYYGQSIERGKTLLFFDEIQECAGGLASLKYFCEDARDLHVVVAGSLLGVSYMRGESYPVGKVNTLRLYPMSFDEFLLALQGEAMCEVVDSLDWETQKVLKDKLSDLLRQYYYVGGMPEAVLKYIETQDLIAVREIQNEILSAYSRDFAKHAGTQTQRIRQIWNSLPSQLAKENKKFVFGAVREGARAKDFELGLEWLSDAGLIHRVRRCKLPEKPLSIFADESAFKVFVLDVGLLGAMMQLPAKDMIIGDTIFSSYKGAFTENYVMQQMATIKDLSVYYYSKDNSTQEIDFLVQTPNRIIPIEVKAEENVKAKSLSTFVNIDQKEYNLKGLRFSMPNYAEQGWMENVPLWSVCAFLRKKV